MAAATEGVAVKTAIVTGGYGVLGASLASGLAASGVRVAILGRRRDAAEAQAERIRADGGDATVLVADVLDEAQMRAARDEALDAWGRIDILVNTAGGSVARSRNDSRSIFEVPLDAFDEVLRLNLHGSVIPTMIIAESMAAARTGCVINISSMAALRQLSGVLGYSVAKTGIDSFTRWMAVELARKFGDGLRVNAIAPGFFVTTQNRDVLLTPDGEYTDRAGRRTAVEVELTVKAAERLRRIIGDLTLEYDRVVYVTGDARVTAAVRKAVHALGEADRVELIDLAAFALPAERP